MQRAPKETTSNWEDRKEGEGDIKGFTQQTQSDKK